MKKTHNIVAVVGKYTDGTGQEKNRYMTIGAAFTRDDGTMSLKIESIPVGPGWNGWANLYLPRDNNQPGQQAAPQQRPAAQPAAQPAAGAGDFQDDDIPF